MTTKKQIVEALHAIKPAGCNTDHHSEHGQLTTEIQAAAHNGDNAKLEFLLTHDNEEEQLGTATAKGWQPLHLAASNGHLTCVQHLVDAGAQVDAVDRDGFTPLHR